MTDLYQGFWLTVVAVLWGGTNPFIKRGSAGIENIKEASAICQFFCELKFLIFNWKYMLPFLVNQSGSVVYYLTLASADISLAVPLTNSLTFIFTSVSGLLLGEKINKESCFGMLLVLIGVYLCITSKL